MIRLLEEFDDGSAGLRNSHYSRTILSHAAAYGTEFDFCRFYEMFRRKRVGMISVFNGTAAAELCEGVRVTAAVRRELCEFIDFMQPNVLEIPQELAPRRGLSGYESIRRRFYEIPAGEDAQDLKEPPPSEVYEVLGAPQESYPLWLTDVMRRKNRSQLWFFGIESAVLCVRFALDGRAYVTDLATPEADRGNGYARVLLGKVARHYADKEYTLYAGVKAELWSFYDGIGCNCIGEDIVFTKKK